MPNQPTTSRTPTSKDLNTPPPAPSPTRRLSMRIVKHPLIRIHEDLIGFGDLLPARGSVWVVWQGLRAVLESESLV
jgi:hypothetical protein